MGTSDSDATRDDGAVRAGVNTPMNDLPTAAAPSNSPTDKLANQLQDNSMEATGGASAAVTDSTQPDTTVQRYIRRSKIGSGGFSDVYEAWDNQLHRSVAIKVAREEPGSDQLSYRRFVQEARAVAKLDHDNIVKVFDVGADKDNVPYVVLKYIDGGTLAQRIKTDAKPGEMPTRLPRGQVISMMISIADAIHAAHKAGLVHRDLKPANILLDQNEQPHVSDFGLAVDEKTQRRQKGIVAGTWLYMSPEQIRGEVQYLDGRTDVWSLGVILYELLVGRRPFVGKTPPDVQDEILNREPKPLRQIDDSIPVALEQICFRCLSKQIKDRYSSAADVAIALRDCQEKKPRQRVLLIVVASIVSVVLLMTGYAAFISQSTPQSDNKQLASSPASGQVVFPSDGEKLPNVGQFKPEPAEIPLKPDTNVVALPPQVHIVGKWFHLLRQPPRAIVWSDDDRNSHWENSADEEKLYLSSSNRAMLKLGETESRNYEIELCLFQPPWTGNTGLFFGGHSVVYDGADCRQYEMIHLTCKGERVRSVTLQRVQLILDKNLNHKISNFYAGAHIPELSLRDQKLRICVENGRLISVEWNRTLVRDWGPAESSFHSGSDDCTGEFGVYVIGTTSIFRDAVFLLNQGQVNE